jgi:hypothetical protein
MSLFAGLLIALRKSISNRKEIRYLNYVGDIRGFLEAIILLADIAYNNLPVTQWQPLDIAT